MRFLLSSFLLLWACVHATEAVPSGAAKKEPEGKNAAPVKKHGPPKVRILRVGPVRPRVYPYALPSLLTHLGDKSTIHVDPLPEVVESFEDPKIFDYPFIYVNFSERQEWTFSDLEKKNLREYLRRGGFIHIDAGINASFLRGNIRAGQHHSFADWEATPQVRDAFKTVFPGKGFKPLPRSHKIFSCFYKGLPQADKLPDTVRDFVVKEKWPQGTYSFVGLRVKDRLAVLCTPIISMGWGKNNLGNWNTNIGFRTRESAKDLGERLKNAAYGGERFKTKREDGRQDVVYCQIPTRPAWVQEPDNRWRVFRYYHSREISEFAHEFYTQLGVNIITYALTH